MDLLIFWKGILSALFIAISTSLLGVFLIVRRMSLLGAGLSHVAFGGVALAFVFELEPFTFTLFYTILSGLLLEFLIERKKVPADTLISLFFSFGVALAVVLLGITGNMGANVYSFLFGSMLTASNRELYLSFLVFLGVLAFVLLNYRSLLLLCFNEEIARLKGVKVRLLNYLLIALSSASIALSIKAVGLVLSASFISIPSMTALLVASSFLSSLLLSVLFSVVSLALGITLSFYKDLPSGGAVVMVMTLLFAFLLLLSLLRKRLLKAP